MPTKNEKEPRMTTKAITREEVLKWCAEHETPVTLTVLPLTPRRKPDPDEPKEYIIDRPKQKTPWYQREPQGWRKYPFLIMRFLYERWEAFAAIAVIAGVMALAYWATVMLFG